MTRRVLSATSVISLVLCAGTAGLWVFSQFRQIGCNYYRASVEGQSFAQRNVATYADRSGCLLIWSLVEIPGMGSDEFLRQWRAMRSAQGMKNIDVRVTPTAEYRLGGPEPMSTHWGFGLLDRPVVANSGSPIAVGGRLVQLRIPYAFICGMLAILPAVWWFRAARQRHRNPGQCRRCGYDLRASSGRCPECGSPIATTTAY